MFTITQGLTYDDVLLVPGYNGIRSRKDVNTEVELGKLKFSVPVMSSNMDTITGVEMANRMAELGGLPILHRFMTIEENIELFKKIKEPERVGVSVGVGDPSLVRAEALIAVGAKIICVDVAHGHSKGVNQMIRRLREIYKDNIYVIGGNVVTYAGADYLAAAGADAIKIGVGPGSVCSTRIKTGYGYPQLSAIASCAKVDRVMIADGGIKTSGDVVKAIAAGAHFVMLGGMLAGTDETPGDVLEQKTENGTALKVKRFRGMASREAQVDFMGVMADWKTAEGISTEVPCKGPVADVIQDIMGGLRSALTYCGARNIAELQRKAEFVQITPPGYLEGMPHALGRLTL